MSLSSKSPSSPSPDLVVAALPVWEEVISLQCFGSPRSGALGTSREDRRLEELGGSWSCTAEDPRLGRGTAAAGTTLPRISLVFWRMKERWAIRNWRRISKDPVSGF